MPDNAKIRGEKGTATQSCLQYWVVWFPVKSFRTKIIF